MKIYGRCDFLEAHSKMYKELAASVLNSLCEIVSPLLICLPFSLISFSHFPCFSLFSPSSSLRLSPLLPCRAA